MPKLVLESKTAMELMVAKIWLERTCFQKTQYKALNP